MRFPLRHPSWSVLLLSLAVSPVRAQVPSATAVIDSAERMIATGRAAQATAALEELLRRATAEHDTLALVRALNKLTRAAYNLGDLNGALAHGQRVMALGARVGAWREVGSALVEQAIVADQLSPPDTVKALYERALRYYLLAGDTAACAVVYDNLGYYPLLHNDIAGAIAYSRKAMGCLRDTTHRNYHRSAAIVESSLCNYFTWSGDMADGIRHGLNSVRHAERSGDITILVHASTQLAGAYVRAGAEHLALPLLLRSDSVARGNSLPLNKRRDIPELLGIVYEELGDPVKALSYYKERSALHDSLRTDVVRREVERMQRRGIQVADSLRQVAALLDQERMHQQRMTEERARRDLLITAIGVVIIVALFTWSRLRLVRRKNAEILDAQEKLLASEKAREAEQVRTRIARDVHDDISGDLTKIGMLGTAVRDEMAQDPAQAAQHVERIKELSRNVGRSLQDIVWAVDPARDSARELVDRAALHTERMLAHAGVSSTVAFGHTGTDVELDPATRRDIYLLLKEALNNALKYADARHLQVTLLTRAEGFELCVKDDGKGFDAQAAMNNGNGLGNMEARAKQLGATWSVRSALGAGTEIRAQGGWKSAPVTMAL